MNRESTSNSGPVDARAIDQPRKLSRIKLWTSVGACLLLPTLSTSAAVMPVEAPVAPVLAGGEGGEGGDLKPQSYQLLLDEEVMPHYDASAVRKAYRDLAEQSYSDAIDAVDRLAQAIEHLLDKPSQKALDTARARWRDAHLTYLRTEPLRFYDGPIDGPADGARPAGPEGRMNAWPLNEAVIDYVKGQPKSGLVQADPKVPLDRDLILKSDQVSDEADVTTGFHAIEFLLWGQDQSAGGPGARPWADYVVGGNGGTNDRRRAYVRELLKLLREDLVQVRSQWQPGTPGSYAAAFARLDDYEAVGRMLHGMTALVGLELTSERLSVALDSGTQEDETNCFSDTTHLTYAAGLAGIRRFYSGTRSAPGVATLVRQLDPAANAAVLSALDEADAAAKALPAPFDQVVSSPAGSTGRAKAEALVAAFTELTGRLKAAGRALGVLVPVAGGDT